MKQHVWQLQEAKNKFSQVVEHALKQGPQIITRHGVEESLCSLTKSIVECSNQSNLADFFRESPLKGVDLDLRRDKSGMRNDIEL